MPNLFGLDIAGIVASSLQAAGGLAPAVLTSITQGTRTSGAIASGTNPTSVDYPCEAIEEAAAGQIPGLLIQTDISTITLIAKSIAGGAVWPKPQDYVSVNGGKRYSIVHVDTDPAAATHVCKVIG